MSRDGSLSSKLSWVYWTLDVNLKASSSKTPPRGAPESCLEHVLLIEEAFSLKGLNQSGGPLDCSWDGFTVLERRAMFRELK